jgi:hypothetical protein
LIILIKAQHSLGLDGVPALACEPLLPPKPGEIRALKFQKEVPFKRAFRVERIKAKGRMRNGCDRIAEQPFPVLSPSHLLAITDRQIDPFSAKIFDLI